ncbi:WD40-repeat-containing domain protein [Fomes fomentarius]|nr:WD40-repeat-containing domain protein [Fomes fomentarius]
MLQSTIETLTFDVVATNDPILSLISRLERLRSLRLFLPVDMHLFTPMIELATNVLNSLARLDVLTIELKYKTRYLTVFADIRKDETAEACQQFEESAVRLNPSRVLFMPRCNGRERTELWTRTLQCIFSTLHKQCPFKVQCQGDLDDLAEPDSYGHDGTVDALAASPDGRWITSASDNKTLILWRVERGHGGPAHIEVAVDWYTDQDTYKLQFSPDSRYIASLADIGEICIWSVPTSTLLGILGGFDSGKTSETSCMAWLQDGTLVVSAITTETKRLFCWYTVPSKERTGSGLTTPPSVVPPDATYSLTDRGLVRLVDRHQPMETVREEFLEHLISSDGSLLAILDADGTSITMWDMDFGTPSPPRHMPLGLPTPGLSIEEDPLIAVSDLATQKSFIGYRGGITPHANGEWVCRMWFSPCGHLFATSISWDCTLHLRRASDGMHLSTFNLITCPIIGLFTQDSQMLVYGDEEGTVYIRDIGHLDVLAEATTTVAH